MAAPTNSNDFSFAGIGTGGLLVIAGILIALFASTLLGLIVALVGLVAFGGFASQVPSDCSPPTRIENVPSGAMSMSSKTR